MDNKVGSQIKRALRVTGIICFISYIWDFFINRIQHCKENIERGTMYSQSLFSL